MSGNDWRNHRLVVLVLATVLATAAGGTPAGATVEPGNELLAGPREDRPAQVAPPLWEQTRDGQVAGLLVVLAEQADVSAAARLPDQASKARYVYDVLRAAALRTQAPLRAWLDRQGIPYRAHYLVNMLALRGDRALLRSLARRPDVARLVANPWVDGLDDPPGPQHSAAGRPPTEVEWGVEFVHAPAVWNTYGVLGQGVVVGGQDTGIQWDHPALVEQYRGWDGTAADHDYNWHDAIGGNGPCPDPAVPCDDYGHGTHTLGTAVGSDGQEHQIGVAPGAQWIGCRNMDRGTGSPSTYTECFEFMLAPYPTGGDPLTQGDPGRAAQVLNNSWNCPPQEGCDHFTLQQVVENVRAAGIMVVASGGNNGSACGSVLYPIGTYDASFSVGAVNAGGQIAPFSSRGPVTYNGTGIAKPDLAAPGVNVLSARPGNGYGFSSGTSMAAPHVAGVVALLWSAEPSLMGQVDATEFILTRTAQHVDSFDCGSNGWPNYTYGWGYVDALAAVQAVREPAAVQGRVTQRACQPAITMAVPGAEVAFAGDDGSLTTLQVDASGAYSVTLPPGPYTVTATFPGHQASLSSQAWLLGRQDNVQSFTFDPSPAGTDCTFLPALSRR